jgi:DNA-binding XRE family transcriptional regulator
MTEEVWKSVPRYPAYEVSNHGNVRSYWRRVMLGYPEGTKMVIDKTPQLLKPSFDGARIAVYLGDGQGNNWSPSVANLVLTVFIRPPEKGEVARHLNDPDPFNCNVENLEWGTRKQNSHDITRHHGKHSRAKLTAVQVQEIRKRLATKTEMQKDLAKEYGVSQGTITLIKQGKVGVTVPDLTDEQPVPSNWAEQGE